MGENGVGKTGLHAVRDRYGRHERQKEREWSMR